MELISRADAIKDAESWVAVDEHERHLQKNVIEWLKEFPTAELGTNLAEVGTDLILRQAAIDAIRTVIGDNRSISVCEAVKQLPPIQPEIVRCGECEYCVHHPSTPNTKRPCDPPQPEMWHCGKNREFKPRVMPHDFCSRGKRREVTT